MANKTSGLDIDKFDYMVRDWFYTLREPVVKSDVEMSLQDIWPGGVRSFHECVVRMCNRCRLLTDDVAAEEVLCYHEEDAAVLCAVATARFRLHESVYQNKKTMALDLMHQDMLLLADADLRIFQNMADALRDTG